MKTFFDEVFIELLVAGLMFIMAVSIGFTCGVSVEVDICKDHIAQAVGEATTCTVDHP